jgi:hypothetical protein
MQVVVAAECTMAFQAIGVLEAQAEVAPEALKVQLQEPLILAVVVEELGRQDHQEVLELLYYVIQILGILQRELV